MNKEKLRKELHQHIRDNFDVKKIDDTGEMWFSVSDVIDIVKKYSKKDNKTSKTIKSRNNNFYPVYNGKETCERCNEAVERDKAVWLELSMTDGKYYTELPEGHESQGGFAFGSGCARIVLNNGGEQDW